jgi:hypothetical protein
LGDEFERVGIERDDGDLSREVALADEVDDGGNDDLEPFRCIALDLHQQCRELADDVEDLGEGGNDAWLRPAGELGAGIQGLEFGEGEVGDRAGAIGGVVQRGIVKDDELVVGGELDVELDGLETEGNGVVEPGEGRFWCFALGAAMAVNAHDFRSPEE